MEYSCVFFGSCSKTNFQKLELLPNLCLIIVLCAFHSAPIIALCAETCIHPFHIAYKNCLSNSYLEQRHSPHSLVHFQNTFSSKLALYIHILSPPPSFSRRRGRAMPPPTHDCFKKISGAGSASEEIFWNVEVRIEGSEALFDSYFVCDTAAGSLWDLQEIILHQK